VLKPKLGTDEFPSELTDIAGKALDLVLCGSVPEDEVTQLHLVSMS
jgi:hypothetical protein